MKYLLYTYIPLSLAYLTLILPGYIYIAWLVLEVKEDIRIIADKLLTIKMGIKWQGLTNCCQTQKPVSDGSFR